MDNNIKNVISEFLIKENVTDAIGYGNGHINDTYMISTDTDKKYILQRINSNVFKKPADVVSNIEKVIEHLSKKSQGERSALSFVPTKNNTNFYQDGENFWRIYNFIENAYSPETMDDPEEFYNCAYAFGDFQKKLADFPADELKETIPDFHNTPKRFERFMQVVTEDKLGLAKNVQEEIEFVKARKDFCSALYNEYEKGNLPIRVTHNDTKINNVMLDNDTKEPLCVIDLDTVMPGFSVNDFGDSIRFGAATAAEDETDVSKMTIDLGLYESFMKGFSKGCAGLLKKSEMLLMPVGSKMMTFECGMRFLTDYLEGNVYFKTKYPEHNLVRCRTQFKLVSEMEKNWDKMIEITKKYC